MRKILGSLTAVAIVLGAIHAVSGAQQTPLTLTVERDIIYRKVDGEELKLDAYLPKGEGKFPAIVIIHGGAWRGGNKSLYAPEAQALAQQGYAAFSISYRLLPKYKFPACVEDCKSAVRYVRRNAEKYKVDPKRIGAYGHSAGGHLAAMLATTDGSAKLEGDPDAKPEDSRVQAAACMAGVFNFPPILSPLFREFLGGTAQEKPEAYKLASPMQHVTKDTPPMLLLHGDQDTLVPLAGSERFADTLKKAGVECELVVLKGVGHIYQQGHGDEVRQAMVKFFDKHLKERK